MGESSFIPLAECEDRRLYAIYSRNLVVGAFRKATGGFIGIRQKFNSLSLFEEYHYEKSTQYGTVRPQTALDVVVPEGIVLAEYMPSRIDPSKHHGSFCTGHDRECEFRPDDGVRPPGKWFHIDDGSLLEENDNPSARQNQALYDLIEANTDMSIFQRRSERPEDE